MNSEVQDRMAFVVLNAWLENNKTPFVSQFIPFWYPRCRMIRDYAPLERQCISNVEENGTGKYRPTLLHHISSSPRL